MTDTAVRENRLTPMVRRRLFALITVILVASSVLLSWQTLGLFESSLTPELNKKAEVIGLTGVNTLTRAGDPTAGTTSSDISVITSTLALPTITYQLNIANAGTSRNEILARPSLVAIEGQKSDFFSGENIKASAVTANQEGAAEVERDIGVKLAVTPEEVGKNRVKLLIEVERTFLQPRSASTNYTFQLRTSKTTVAANVFLRRGETLILSGLSEKETVNTRDGVPGLQDVPLIQYLFSKQETRDFNRSVLVLVTPRKPEYTFRPRDARKLAGAARGANEDEVLNELKARYTDWFRPYPNWASVFHHLQNNTLYREFRTGDVALERWDTQTSLGARLKTALGFLHY